MKRPHLQIKILKLIALAGKSSQREAAIKLNCKPPTVFDAFKVLITKKLILEIKGATELSSGFRREKFYKLSQHDGKVYSTS